MAAAIGPPKAPKSTHYHPPPGFGFEPRAESDHESGGRLCVLGVENLREKRNNATTEGVAPSARATAVYHSCTRACRNKGTFPGSATKLTRGAPWQVSWATNAPWQVMIVTRVPVTSIFWRVPCHGKVRFIRTLMRHDWFINNK